MHSIPPNIGHLRNLKVLNIVDNYIDKLPVSILQLNTLSAIWISNNQSEPLVKLHKEQDADGQYYLTCFLLPQYQKNRTDDNFINLLSNKKILFSVDPRQDQKLRLMRSPTPYPKELRVLAKYAKCSQKQDHVCTSKSNN